MSLKKKFLASVTAGGAVLGLFALGVTPSFAASEKTVNLKDVAAIQASVDDMSIVDSKGRTFVLTITTTWQRASAKKATLRSLVIRPKSFPSNDCLSIQVGSTSNINFSAVDRTLCKQGLLTYAPNKTTTAYSGTTNLGQLWFKMPDPWAPFSGGARWITIQYNS